MLCKLHGAIHCELALRSYLFGEAAEAPPPRPPCSAAPALSLVKACLQGMATQSLEPAGGPGASSAGQGMGQADGCRGPLFSPLVELEDGFLLFVGLDGAGSKAPEFSNGISRGQAPLFHQVTGQHGASAAKAQGTVHSHSLRRSSLVGWSLVPYPPLPFPYTPPSPCSCCFWVRPRTSQVGSGSQGPEK